MSGLKISVSNEFSEFYTLVKSFTDLRMAFLSSIGRQGGQLLRRDLLSGQALNLKRGEKDIKGRYLISHRVGKRSTVSFSSYSTNLFENGRTLRDGTKEPGKHIIKGQFKSLLNSRLQSFADKSFSRVIEKHLD